MWRKGFIIHQLELRSTVPAYAAAGFRSQNSLVSLYLVRVLLSTVEVPGTTCRSGQVYNLGRRSIAPARCIRVRNKTLRRLNWPRAQTLAYTAPASNRSPTCSVLCIYREKNTRAPVPIHDDTAVLLPYCYMRVTPLRRLGMPWNQTKGSHHADPQTLRISPDHGSQLSARSLREE